MSQQKELRTHDPVWNDSRWRARVRDRLIDWFTDNARDLPWRTTQDPYRVWVSEIMLQQTQVATVVPYYERFLESFPTVCDLAGADEQRLLKHWEGLGYYRRARSMHRAAQQIVDQHEGVFPTDFASVIALPGIGRYTAGAILSISRDQCLPILEGNTVRVFSRWVALQMPPGTTESMRLLWQIAEAMLPTVTRKKAGEKSAQKSGPGTFNQAAMELGALICTPKNPKCPQCPVKGSCRARRLGLEHEIPGKVKNVTYEDRIEYALIIAEQKRRSAISRYLIRPLPEGGRWAGLWDFPRTCDDSFDSVDTAAETLSETLGRSIAAGIRLKTIKHAVTKYRITLHVHAATMIADRTTMPKPWRYASLDEMASLPMSVTGRKITDFLAVQENPAHSV